MVGKGFYKEMLYKIDLAKEKVCSCGTWGAFQVESTAGAKAVRWKSTGLFKEPSENSEEGMACRNVAPEEV